MLRRPNWRLSSGPRLGRNDFSRNLPVGSLRLCGHTRELCDAILSRLKFGVEPAAGALARERWLPAFEFPGVPRCAWGFACGPAFWTAWKPSLPGRA